MVIEFENAWLKRMDKANDALNDGYDSLDPKDPKYYENLKILSGLHDKVSTDFNNYIVVQADEENRILEDAKFKEEKKSNLLDKILGAAGLIVTVGTFMIGERNINIRFNKACKYEEENAFLTASDKIAVREGLERPKKGIFGLFGKK